ncbi:MAG: hypothetical protein GY851_05280 [bacterium]|nr:hypothetical protein [bacterium]
MMMRMRVRTRRAVALAIACLTGCFWIGVVSYVLAGEGVASQGNAAKAPAVRVQFPADKVVLESTKLQVVARLARRGSETPPLLVDGNPASWDPVAPPNLVAKLTLTPGLHTLRVGETDMKCFVSSGKEGEKRPDKWPVLKHHPVDDKGWLTCSQCHRVDQVDDRQRVGRLKDLSKTCTSCHTKIQFEKTHKHEFKPYRECDRCHGVHGSTRPSLLKAPKAKLCVSCHE